MKSRPTRAKTTSDDVGGRRFRCQPGCTKCCEVHGFVYLSESDVLKAADFLGLTPKAFEKKFVIRYSQVIRLRKPIDAQCFFLKNGGCSIHPAKPTQCRLYPFWPELVEDTEAWDQAKETCPGIGVGKLVQIGKACEVANEMKQAYPHMYDDWK